jgi:hypothetical protein
MSSKNRTAKRSATARNVAKGKPAAGGAKTAGLLLPEGENELIVRMYRQGLGDCFLLALPAKTDRRVRYVLIDCGVHARQTDGPARLARVMDHLVAATGSRIDVVVATHEHADHLSGFVQKGSPFLKDNLKIGELWVAWTEKRGDQQADRLRQKRGTAQQLIDKAVEEARQRAGVAGQALADRLMQLTDFDRPADGSVDVDAVVEKIRMLQGTSPPTPAVQQMPAPGDAPALGVARRRSEARAKPTSNELALRLLMLKAGDDRTRFCEPGTIRQIDNVDNLRAYVMGPPRSDLLEKDKPSKIRGASEDDPGGAYKEVYLTASQANRALELSPRFQLEVSASGGRLPDDWRYPFTTPFRRRCELSAPSGVGPDKFWRGEPPEATRSLVEGTYLAAQASWRRIDGDWLGAAETLALNLDGDTNNTSLVLAFEWGKAGRGVVLLFAADAQVGNWLSWRDQPYGDEKLKADDLLSRVLLYKVGHHGSHNATVRRDPRDPSSSDPLGAPFGLELMNDLIAMIPVDRAAAEKKMPNPWKMPHEPLYRRLREKAGRRIMRSDLKLDPLDGEREDPDVVPPGTDWTPVPGLAGVRWRSSNERFETETTGPLCYDVAITLRD